METTISSKILPFGARVRLSNVDMHGYCGRELHPEETDVGFLGVVIENMVMTWNDGASDIEPKTNVAPGTVFVSPTASYLPEGEAFHDVMYTVMSSDGRTLQLMEHEIEVIVSIVTS